MAAWYGLYLNEYDMIGIIMSNANASIAPWGGTLPLFGTNPLCITIPAKTRPHIVLDMAMSIVARGKIRAAQEKGGKIPSTWAVGPDGTPTEDPAEAIKGSLLPIGGPKGYCLALIIDILSGMLSGAHCSTDIKSMFDLSEPSGMGHYFQAIDIEKFIPADTFKEHIDTYIDRVKQSPRNEGTEEIYVPGELEYLSTVQKRKEGIDIPDTVCASLREIEETYLQTHIFSPE
jgi:LDH2 family malate/lactate/ureidoglycolate dehydrogenase